MVHNQNIRERLQPQSNDRSRIKVKHEQFKIIENILCVPVYKTKKTMYTGFSEYQYT